MSDESRENSMCDTTLEFSFNVTPDVAARRQTLIPESSEKQKETAAAAARLVGKSKDDVDPVRVLQLSQNLFVSDSMDEDEDDVSAMIPPTPADTVPFIIPSTPTVNESTTLIDESTVVEKVQGTETQKKLTYDEDDDDWNKATQPLCPIKQGNFDHESDNDETFADTEAMFTSYMDIATQPQNVSPVAKDKEDVNDSNLSEDNDWNLRLTDTQPLDTVSFPIADHTAAGTQPSGTVPLEALTEKQEDTPVPDEKDRSLNSTPDLPELNSDDKEVETILKQSKKEAPKVSTTVSKRSDTPEEVGLFAEIENFVKIARESEAKSSQDSHKNGKSPSSPSVLPDCNSDGGRSPSILPEMESDEDEIAPSQTSTSSAMLVLRPAKPPTDVLIPDTEPVTFTEAEKISIDVADHEIEETNQFGSEPQLDQVEIPVSKSPIKKAARSTKVQKKKEAEKVNIDIKDQEVPETNQFGSEPQLGQLKLTISKSSIKKAGRLTKAQKKKESVKKKVVSLVSDVVETPPHVKEGSDAIVNGQVTNSDSFNLFRLPHNSAKKFLRTPSKMRPLGRLLLTEMSPKPNFKTEDHVEPSYRKQNLFLHPNNLVGSFEDAKSLEKRLNSVGVTMEEEKIKSHSSPTNYSTVEKDIIRINMSYRVYIKENKVWEEFSAMDEDSPSQSKVEISPQNSSSTSGSKHSFTSGDMGDISSSLSSKSQGSSASSVQNENKATFSFSGDRNLTSRFQTLKANAFTKFPSLEKLSSQEDFTSPILSPLKLGKKMTTLSESSETSATKGKKKKAARKPSAKRAKSQGEGDNAIEAKRSKTEDFQVNEGATTSKDDSMSRNSGKRKGGSRKAAPKQKNSRKKAAVVDAEYSVSSEIEQISAFISAVTTTTVPQPQKDSAVTTTPLPLEDKGGSAVPLLLDDSADDTSSGGNILPGVGVMARWKDGYFYPGIVESVGDDLKCCVIFDDGASRTVLLENLLKIALLQVGTKVLALSPDNYYDPGIVSGHFRDENGIGYVVEQESGLTRRYKRGAVILSTELAKPFAGCRPIVQSSADTINLDNIIGGKRKRKSLQDQLEPPKSPPPPKRSARRKKLDSNLDTTESSANEEVLPQIVIVKKVENEIRDSVPSTSAQKQPRARTRKAKSVSKSPKRSLKGAKKQVELPSSEATESEDISTVSAPQVETNDVSEIVPVRGSKLFQGYAFLLTHAIKKTVEESSDSEGNTLIFDKEHLCRIIISGGGMVLDTFEEAQKCTSKHVILLANTHLRTIKYLQCVAANIPCIQQQWIQECSISHKIISEALYMLSTGYSIVQEEVIRWHGRANIFKELKIAVISEKKNEFVNIWTPVLLAAKAELVQKYNLPTFSIAGTAFMVDLIVTNSSCPPNVLTAAKRCKIPIVSSEYVIQCIIIGYMLPYEAHPKFRHDYKD